MRAVVQNFWKRLTGIMIFLGKLLLLLLISLLFVDLGFHMFSDIWGIACETIRADGHNSLLKMIATILEETIPAMCSSIVRILIPLLAAGISWLFLYWQAKQAIRQRTFWQPLILSVVVVVIFSWFFWEKLGTEAEQEAVRNLILLTAGIVGWYFLYQRARTAERGVTVERLTLAIKQLSNDKESIRIDGIRSLNQIAKSSEEEREKIVQMLSDRICELSRADGTQRQGELEIKSTIETLVNIAKPLGDRKKKVINLFGVSLSGLNFAQIDLSYFPLVNTNLSQVHFLEVDFTNTDLSLATVNETIFDDCKGLTKEQVMRALWQEGSRPRKLPDEWNLPSVNPI